MAMKDAQAAVDAVKNAGKVGIVGYCWGGFVAWMASAKLNGLRRGALLRRRHPRQRRHRAQGAGDGAPARRTA